VADLHVPEPQFIDVQNKTSDNATLKYSNPQFGEAYIKTASLTVDIPIKGLTPGKEYDFYGYVMNMNGVVGSTYKRLSFTTNSKVLVNINKLFRTSSSSRICHGYKTKHFG